ncbi:molybdate ABC transporter permease subunit [Oceanobacter mangrovi]|uniref:molybdate ABC transporter permease subunit n=1 Tax=Oceanobacter mangrovi TaxID=2862510 RepID=UPI001C8D4534|nr:molybdate ABC transporter permease subunit [Oceanobacter mangrovi]
MELSEADFTAIWLTLELASLVTLILLVISTPIALWLVRSNSRARPFINAVVALPLVLPPSVLGFYLLIAMGPHGPLGKFTESIGLGTLPFTFAGLVVASVIYSLPFVVQPIQNALAALGNRPAEVAATLGASPLDTFFRVTLPLARSGFLTAAVLGFAHTVGEFGVVLMIGGNIPDETRVISLQIYDHVEALDYTQAHILSALMVGFSFVVLLLLYGIRQPAGGRSWT